MRLDNIEALKVRNRNERAERYIALKRHDKAVRSTHRADITQIGRNQNKTTKMKNEK